MKVKRNILRLMLVLILIFGMSVQAAAANDAKDINMMIVLDGSTSLILGENSTDPEGHRFNAISMVLDLMQEQDNQVGAVVFSAYDNVDNVSAEAMKIGLLLESELRPIDSDEAKRKLMEEIKSTTTDYPKDVSGYTDSGTALLAAAQELAKVDNGNESVILLFTDGRTKTRDMDMKKYKGVDKEDLPLYSQSIKNREQAITLIKENDITLCCVHLNGQDDEAAKTEIADLIRRANGIDEDVDAEEMGELYIPVREAGDLAAAFKQFYSIIANTENMEFDQEVTLVIPDEGVSELNLSILAKGSTLKKSDQILKNTKVTIKRKDDADARPISAGELAQMLSREKSYAIYKLQLEPGVWTIHVDTPNQSLVETSLDLNTNVKAEIATISDEWIKGKRKTVYARMVKEDDTPLDSYDGYQCVLTVNNISNGTWEEHTMEYDAGSNSFVCELTVGPYGKYYGQAQFIAGEAIKVESDVLKWEVFNHKPIVPENGYEVPVVLSLKSHGAVEVDLASLVTDLEDEVSELRIFVDENGYPEEGFDWNPEDNVLYLDGVKGGDGKMFIRYVDTDDAESVMELNIMYLNMATPQLTRILLSVLIVVAVVGTLSGYFVYRRRRSEFLEGELHLTVPMGGKEITLKIPANECLRSNLWKIFRCKESQLVDQAWLESVHGEHDVCAGFVKKFLKENKQILSKIKITRKHDRAEKKDLCYITGLNCNDHAKNLDHLSETYAILKNHGKVLVIRYVKYN